jgi:hypothetical protein
MAASSRLTVVNGILAQFAELPVTVPDETEHSKTIDSELNRLVPLFQEATMDWSFLRTTVKLSTPLSESVSPEWGYTFQFPADYLRIKKVHYALANSFEIRGDQILADSSSITIDYIRLSDSFSKFPRHFENALIFYCASILCLPITRQDDLSIKIVKYYEDIVKPEAYAVEKRLESGYSMALNRHSRIRTV